jgi:hypothetical protein
MIWLARLRTMAPHWTASGRPWTDCGRPRARPITLSIGSANITFLVMQSCTTGWVALRVYCSLSLIDLSLQLPKPPRLPLRRLPPARLKPISGPASFANL